MEPTIPGGQRDIGTDKVRPFRPVARPVGRVLEATVHENFQSVLSKQEPAKALADLKKATQRPASARDALTDFLTTTPTAATVTAQLEASRSAYSKAEELAALVKSLKYKRPDGAAALSSSALPKDFDDAQYVTILDGLLQQSDQRIRMTKKFIRMLKHA